MKFGRYLEDNATPEWRRAYIDYKGCKKRIKVVEQRLRNRSSVDGESQTRRSTIDNNNNGEDEDEDDDDSDNDHDHGPSAPKSPSSSKKTPSLKPGQNSRGTTTPAAPRPTGSGRNTISTPLSPSSLRRIHSTVPPLDLGEPSDPHATSVPRPARSRVAFTNESDIQEQCDSPVENETAAHEKDGREEGNGKRARMESGESERSRDTAAESEPHTPLNKATTPTVEGLGIPNSSRAMNSPKKALKRMFSMKSTGGNSPHSAGAGASPSPNIGNRSIRTISMSPRIPVRAAETYEDLYQSLQPDEQAFFDFLETQLQKVESFYLSRQEEAVKRFEELKSQLKELAEHRKLYHQTFPGGHALWESKVERWVPGLNPATAQATVTSVSNAAQKLHLRIPYVNSKSGSESDTSNGKKKNGKEVDKDLGQNGTQRPGLGVTGGRAGNEAGGGAAGRTKSARDAEMIYTAEKYTKYKQELRRAVLEYYRYLEIIKNYRIMNVTGFRKALKKFEKITKIQCLESFTDERINSQAFAGGKQIDRLLKITEDLFSDSFEGGDKKRARDKLRRQDQVNSTHYTSMFRSGLMIGIAVPMSIISVVEALKFDGIPASEGILQVYGGFFLAVLFAMLFELNLDAFVTNRINYEFVMELSRPVLDFRSYLEIPAFLYLTLSACMYFTYFRIGAENVDPTTWPLAWLVFVVVFFLNPFPIFRRHSRYWLLRVLWRVITPGWSRVEFIAFFIADELNSLSYTLSNFIFIGCGYANHWPADIYDVCPSGSRWYYILVLSLPAFIRFVQCLKRYLDSDLKIHLVNAGKYFFAILQYCGFVWWRSRGSMIPDGVFIAWITVAMISAAYNCTWDFVVDWSLLRPGAGLLRQDRGYSSPYVYYFAMVTNFFIRFIYVWYIPQRASYTRARSFFFALAEMLRRWQWNFFRVETEHLGNADAYRVTREIPLPYRKQPDSEDEAELERLNPVSAKWAKLRKAFLDGKGRGPDELNVGPRGDRAVREYEARRTEDLDVLSPTSIGSSGDEEGHVQANGQRPEGQAEQGNDNNWDGVIRRLRLKKQFGKPP